MENNKKTKVKINAFDVVLILLVLCIIGTFIFKIYTGVAEDKNTNNSEYILTFTCEGEFDSLIKQVKVGDPVYLESGELLGYITLGEGKTDEAAPLEIITAEADGNGSDEQTESHGREFKLVNLSGVLKLNGNAKKSDNENYYVIDEKNISEGAQIRVHTTRAEFTIIVDKIEKVNNY